MLGPPAAGIASSAVRARSADYLDFNLDGRRVARRSAGLRLRSESPQRSAGKPSGDEDEGPLELFRSHSSSPRSDHASTQQYSSASDFWTKAECPLRRGRAHSPASMAMSAGDAMRQALRSPDARLVHSTSLPARCFQPMLEEPSLPKLAPASGNWLKCGSIPESPEALVRVAVARHSLTRRRKTGTTETASVLTGHGERTVVRSKPPRVNGEGIANSLANKASFGIAWRRLPVYSNKGALQTTMVDPDMGALPLRLTPTVMSAGMKELLGPSATKEVEEADPFEKWLLTVGECLRKSVVPTPQRAASPSPSPPGPNLHQTFKPHRKLVRPVAHIATDAPYAWGEARTARSPSPSCPASPVTAHRSPRSARSPSPVAAATAPRAPSRKDYYELRAGGKEYFDLKAAETVPENKRTWQFQQDMARIRVQRASSGRLSLRPATPHVVTVTPAKGFKQDLDFSLTLTGSRETLSTQEPSDGSNRTPPQGMHSSEPRPRWR